jgi:methionyl-tRNA formyltransferase
MRGIVILATDTLHRRYFIKKIIAAGIHVEKIIFETELVQPKFAVGPFYAEEEKEFESSVFFTEFVNDMSGLPVEYVSTINDDRVIEILESVQSSFGVVFGTRKIEQRVIDLFKDGLINVHRGIASQYRGLDTNLWAIYHSDYSNIGVTIHKVADTLDTGDVVYEQMMPLPENIKVFQLRYHETLLATQLTINAVNNYLKNELEYFPQEQVGRYYSFMPLVIKETIPSKLAHFMKAVYA